MAGGIEVTNPTVRDECRLTSTPKTHARGGQRADWLNMVQIYQTRAVSHSAQMLTLSVAEGVTNRVCPASLIGKHDIGIRVQ